MKFVSGLVSVIMSNFNTPEDYLREAIESVLNQTYTDFEFIIIDDCSTDNSLEIIKSYEDERIVIVENEVNLGITKSLNRGLAIAKGEYIARMDADDICLPERLSKQIDYLENNPKVVVCGTGVTTFGEKDKDVIKILPSKDVFQIYLLFGNHINIIHPTAMFKHSYLAENNIKYDEQYRFAQDYRMWVSCSRIGECANVSEVLLKYRLHENAVSSNKKDTQKDCARLIMAEQLSWLGLDLPGDWEEIHYGFFIGRKKYNIETKYWIDKIISNNKIHEVYNQEILEKLLWEKWAETSYFALAKEKNPIRIIKILFNLPLKYWKKLFEIRKNRQEKEW